MAPYGQSSFKEFIVNWMTVRSLEKQRNSTGPTIRHPFWPWIVRILLVVLVGVVLWDNGFSTWRYQYYLAIGVLGLSPMILMLAWLGLAKGTIARVPGLSILLLLMAGYAGIQSIDWVSSDSLFAGNAVRIQQWFLGQKVDISSSLFSESMKTSIERSSELALAQSALPKERFSISLAADDTRCAMAGLLISALLIWISSLAFAERRSHLFLLCSMAVVGIAFACVSFTAPKSWYLPDATSLGQKFTVGTFTNKNVAGTFLSVCLAASVGLIADSLKLLQLGRKKTDRRYKLEQSGFKWLKSGIDMFDGLQTVHIIYVIATTVLFTAVIVTQCRGATLSVVCAAMVVVYVYSNRQSASLVNAAMTTIILIAALALIFLFDFEQKTAESFNRLLEGETMDAKGRLAIFWVNLKAGMFFMASGSGLGTYGYATLPFYEEMGTGWHRYAESIWGHLWVEYGLVGIVALTLFVVECTRLVGRAFRASRHRSNYAIAFGSGFLLVYLFVHSMVDFRLIVPAVFVPVSILLGALYGMSHSYSSPIPSDRSSKNKRRRKKSWSLKTKESLKEEKDLAKAMHQFRQIKEREEDPKIESSPKTDRGFVLTRFTSRGLIGMLLLLTSVGLLYGSLDPLDRNAKGSEWEYQAQSLNALRKKEPEQFKDRLEEQIASIASQIDRYPSADGLRTLGNLHLLAWANEYRAMCLEAFGREPWGTMPTKAMEFRIRLATDSPADDIKRLINRLGGSESLFQRWNQRAEDHRKALPFAPLDWRNQLDSVVWDLSLAKEEIAARLNRTIPLAQHRPNDLFEIGTLAELYDDGDLAREAYRSCVRISEGDSIRISQFHFPRLQDRPLSSEILPKDLSLLDQIARSAQFTMLSKENQEVFWGWVNDQLKRPSMRSREKYFLTWNCLVREGKQEAARSLLEQWIEQFPEDAEAKKAEKSLSSEKSTKPEN